jgi:methionyl-tRNA formyltransferase
MDASQRWYLYCDESMTPQGVVYFSRIDPLQRTALCGFCRAPGAYSVKQFEMLGEALDLAFGGLGLHKISVEICENATRLTDLYRQVGFVEEGRLREQCSNGTARSDAFRFGMLAAEWAQHRLRVDVRLRELAALSHQRTAAVARRKILILSDSSTWLNAYLGALVMDWEAQGHGVDWLHDPRDAGEGDFCFCLSLGQLVPERVRARFFHTLVVHESDLPQGKGWSPLTWQILDGRSRIPVTLLEAANRVDSGAIYAQRWLEFAGHELISELREAQAMATHELCRWFVDHYPESAAEARAQKGEESFYSRRRPTDSRLEPNMSLAAQFNLLRVVDNERYAAWFEYNGHRYRLRIDQISHAADGRRAGISSEPRPK